SPRFSGVVVCRLRIKEDGISRARISTKLLNKLPTLVLQNPHHIRWHGTYHLSSWRNPNTARRSLPFGSACVTHCQSPLSADRDKPFFGSKPPGHATDAVRRR